MDSISVQNSIQKQASQNNDDVTSADIAAELQQRAKAKDELKNPIDSINLSGEGNVSASDVAIELDQRAKAKEAETAKLPDNTNTKALSTEASIESQPSDSKQHAGITKKILVAASFALVTIGLGFLLTRKNTADDVLPKVTETFLPAEETIAPVKKAFKKSKKKNKQGFSSGFASASTPSSDGVWNKCLNASCNVANYGEKGWQKTKSTISKAMDKLERRWHRRTHTPVITTNNTPPSP